MKRAALVTGAARGIGLAVARTFAGAGWEVWGLDLHEPGDGSPFRGFLTADVAEPEQVRRAVATLAEGPGRLDVLVNNAALQVALPLLETPPEVWDRVMAVNLRGALLCAQAAYPLLKAVRGAVVNMSSVHAAATSRSIAAYAVSKGGLAALTRTMALEFAADGVRANAVLPGAVDTEMLRDGLRRGHLDGADEEALLADLGARHPLGRIARPEEIARAVLFLADSEQSSFVTGHCLTVDGGALCRLSTE